ncbi:MAG: DUF2231 domain-containing protein [Fidelibacterota bacterium]
MTSLLPEWAPNIHPLIVHFPIALLTTAVGIHLLELILPRCSKFPTISTALYLLGVIGAWVAFFAGRVAANSVILPSTAIPILNQHADLAERTVALFTVASGIKIVNYFFHKLTHAAWKITGFILSAIALVSLTLTGDQGARLVFEQGIGVQTTTLGETSEMATEKDTVKSLMTSDDGSWIWSPVEGSVESVFKGFRFLRGKPADLSVSSDRGPGILKVTEPVTIITGQKLAGVQMDLQFNLDEFNGTVSLLHHLQDENNYDYLTVSRAELILGRFENDKNKILEKQPITLEGNGIVRVVGSGKHFRGYLNGELVLHGHAGGQPAGFTGIKIEGKGTLGLTKLAVSVIQ